MFQRIIRVVSPTHPLKHGVEISTRDIEVARQGRKHHGGETAGDRIRVLLNPHRMHHARGFAGGIKPGCLPDLLFGHPGDLLNPVQVIFPCPRLQFIETDAPLLDELLVVKTLADDHVDESQPQGRIRPGPQLQPEVGL